MPLTPYAFALLYGPNSIGKTVDLGRALGDDALYLGPPGGLKSVQATWGFTPKWEEIEYLEDASIRIAAELEKHPSKRVKKIGVDDISYLAERTFGRIEEEKKKDTRDKRHIFGILRDRVLAFRDVCRYAEVHVILVGWESVPGIRGKNQDGSGGHYVRGGPRLTGDLPDYFPGMIDLVLRAEFAPMAQPWPAQYRCYPSPEWTMRDRDNVTPDPAPMNIGEILRSQGYNIGRAPCLGPDAEPLVEQVAQMLVAQAVRENAATCEALYQGLLAEGRRPEHARWLVADAWDRATLRRALASRRARFLR